MCCSNRFKLSVDGKSIEHFHFPVLVLLQHIPLCLTHVSDILLADYDTASVVPYIQERLICGLLTFRLGSDRRTL